MNLVFNRFERISDTYDAPSGCSPFSFGYASEIEHALTIAENRRIFQSFLRSLAPLQVFNPLPILARAINRVKRGPTLKQPRWKRGRWKSKT